MSIPPDKNEHTYSRRISTAFFAFSAKFARRFSLSRRGDDKSEYTPKTPVFGSVCRFLLTQLIARHVVFSASIRDLTVFFGYDGRFGQKDTATKYFVCIALVFHFHAQCIGADELLDEPPHGGRAYVQEFRKERRGSTAVAALGRRCGDLGIK